MLTRVTLETPLVCSSIYSNQYELVKKTLSPYALLYFDFWPRKSHKIFSRYWKRITKRGFTGGKNVEKEDMSSFCIPSGNPRRDRPEKKTLSITFAPSDKSLGKFFSTLSSVTNQNIMCGKRQQLLTANNIYSFLFRLFSLREQIISE